MPRDRTEIHVTPTPDSGNLRLVVDQHVVEGEIVHRIDLSYVVEGKPYRAVIDGSDVPRDVRSKVKALFKALLVSDGRVRRQMGFDDDDVSPPADG